MYGLLLESLACYIKENYGEDKWEEIRRAAAVEQTSFSTHQVYPENLIPRLSAKAIEVLQVSERELMGRMGESFVDFVGQYGYDRVLSVLGRHMRDFLNGLDNLHEYLKFSYPRMRAPSFFCENESSTGLTLHYRSKRRGFVHYVMGQIKQVGKLIYDREVEIEVVKEEMLFDMHVVTFNLKFDNRAFAALTAMDREDQRLPLKASIFIEIFPFCILFGPDMKIKNIGNSLSHIVPELLGQDISHVFDLTRPLVEFRFASILKRTNNIFELVSHKAMGDGGQSDDDDDPNQSKKIHLKGQMLYMEEWKMIVFLGTPQMNDLDAMIRVGLYINDLSMHDFSRDLMMAGTQQSVELKLALDQEQQKSKKLEESMKKLDEEMKRTDELLYQMIPKLVADRLRKGENPVDTCQVFECVTILFSDVVTFTEICSRISPMEVVSMLNAMYSIFDRLTELNGVYKVETIGDAYMAVGGAPVKDALHAARTCDMALDMIDAIQGLTDPSTGQHLRIRVGVHSGAVVAGVVGLKMPRYCLFGDSVNTASRMESTSEPMKIHISQTTHELLGSNYSTADRGEISVKGKGQMKTYWLLGKEGRSPAKGKLTSLPIEGSSPASSTGGSVGPGNSGRSTNRGYSPVTMDDVAIKKNIVANNGTPKGSPAHLSQLSGSQPESLKHRRSIVELEKNLQLPPTSSTTESVPVGNKKITPVSREQQQVAAKVSSSGGDSKSDNHLTVSSGGGLAQPKTSSIKALPDKFDLKLICPHGKPLAGQTKSSLGVLRNSKPSSPSPSSSNVVNWSFPPKTKVGPPLPDITVGHNGSSTPVASDPLLAPEDRSGGCISSSLPQSPSNDEAEPPGKSAIHQAVDVGDFCCPSFSGGVRPSRLVAAGGAEQPSVTCSFL